MLAIIPIVVFGLIISKMPAAKAEATDIFQCKSAVIENNNKGISFAKVNSNINPEVNSYQAAVIGNEICQTKVVNGVAVNVDGMNFNNYSDLKEFVNQEHSDSPIAFGLDLKGDKLSFVVDANKITPEIAELLIDNSRANPELFAGKFDNCDKSSDFRWDTLSGNKCLLLYDEGSNYSPSNGVDWNNMTTLHANNLNAIAYFQHPTYGGQRLDLKKGETFFPSEPIKGERVDLYR